MVFSEKEWERYINRLRRVSDEAANKLVEFMHINRDTDGLWNEKQTRKAVIDYAHALSTKYGEAASALACEMYDEVATASGMTLAPAVPADTATYPEVAKAVNGTMKNSQKETEVGAAVGRKVKMAGVDTVMKNAIRDGAEWAWIPHGDSCPFCLMLASNGWQKASKKALKNGHADHIHAHCDCTYAVRFDKSREVEGYDPEAIYQEFMELDGSNWDERVKLMRKKIDAEKRKDEKTIKDTPEDAYKEKTKEWIENFNRNQPKVKKAEIYTAPDGKVYEIDDTNIYYDFDEEEYATAELLSKATGKEVKMCPVVRGKYKNVQTPDYLIGNDNEHWDRKKLIGAGKDAVRDSIKRKAGQASRFVIDITSWKGEEKNVLEQVDKVFKYKNTEFVKELAIISKGKIIKVIKR